MAARARRAARHGLLLLPLFGCAAERVIGVAPPAARPVARSPAGTACPFSVATFTDKRDLTDLGRLGPTEVGGEGFVDALRASLGAIPGHVDSGAAVALKVELLKAYIQGIGPMKSANVVLRVEMTAPGKPVASAFYRGVDNSTNWNGTQSEVQAAFTRALADLSRQLQLGIRPLC